MLTNFPQSSLKMTNAILYLFSPREFVQHHHRPLEYNFRQSVVESILENIVQRPTMSSNVNLAMSGTPEINQAVVPSANGFDMNTQVFSNNWTFCLLTDVSDDMTSNLTTRYVTMGICLQEPIGNHGLASATPESFLNPNCTLMVTKQIAVNQHQTLGPAGATKRAKTLSDMNLISYDQEVFQDPMITGQDYFVMSPSAASRSVAIDEYDNVTAVTNMAEALNIKRFDKVSAPIESPRRHMREIINGIDTGMQHVLMNNAIGDFGDGIPDRLEDSAMSFVGNMPHIFDDLSNTNQIYHNRSGIITDGYSLLGGIMTKFMPKVQLVTIPRHSNADVLPQSVRSPSTVWSSLVCSVIPTHMNATNLSAVSFMYNSFHDAINVMHLESALSCDQEQLQFMWKRFEYLIRTEMFPVLMANCGEFDLQVMSMINSTTDCVLNFLDFSPLPVNTIYQENTILGGMISPLIGTGDVLTRNGYQLNKLTNVIGEQINFNNPNIY